MTSASDTPKSAMNMSESEYQAALDQFAKNDIEVDYVRRHGRPSPTRPGYTPEELAETERQIAADKAAKDAGAFGRLPEHLRTRNAVDMSPLEHDEACRILGLPRLSWLELEGQQAAWLRKNGRG